MRCSKCIWYDSYQKKCIRLGKRILIPDRFRVCGYYNKVPEMVVDYIIGMSKITGTDIDSVMKSEPVKKYLEKIIKERSIW